MPLPIMPVSQDEWDRAPTAHRLLVKQAALVLRDGRPLLPSHRVLARMRRLTTTMSQTMRARQVLGTVFGFRTEVLQTSTTRVVADVAEGGPLIHLRAWNGADVVIASYDHGGRDTYSVGRFDGERHLWSDEIRLDDVRDQFDRDHHAGYRMAEAIGLRKG